MEKENETYQTLATKSETQIYLKMVVRQRGASWLGLNLNAINVKVGNKY